MNTLKPCVHCKQFSLLTLISSLCFLLSIPSALVAQTVRQQVIELNPGWNAVWLEVDPSELTPSRVFADLPVDVVATYSGSVRAAQFVNDPSADMLASFGWAVWYAPTRSDAFLTTLSAIQGGRAYLMHAATNATLEVVGQIPPVKVEWIPNSYNFIGFPVQDPGGPTFSQFFRHSSAHNHNKIYRLVNGKWRQVLNPNQEVMRSGEAFWIFSQGRSTYQGPLDVRADSRFGLVLSAETDSNIHIRNAADHPVQFWVDHVIDHHDAIPMAVPVNTFDEEAVAFRTVTVPMGANAWTQDFPTLEAGAGIRLPLRLHLPLAQPGDAHSLLRVRSDLGTLFYLPVQASRPELAGLSTESPLGD